MTVLERVFVSAESGLEGDRFTGRGKRTRQVTLVQAEHLPVIAALLHQDRINPAHLRRNIVVSGINLLALKGKQFKIGEVVLEHTGLCHPCGKMERRLGAGGFNAVRGHGGITAQVVTAGQVGVGDVVRFDKA